MTEHSINNFSKSHQYIAGVALVCFVSAACFGLSAYIGYKVVAFVLLVTVSLVAMLFDIMPVLLVAVLSALIWDFFFIPPRFTFSVGTAEDGLMLMMYFLIVLVNAALTYKIRKIEKHTYKKEERENAIKLYNTLFNSLSHELQTPIATIIGASDTLKDGVAKLSEKNKNELLNAISIASLRLNQQVENLMNMSRLESGFLQLKRDWCDINELVYSVVNKLQDKATRHDIKVEVPDGFPLFKLDFGIMEQVIYNLLKNAIQYTPEDSLITVTAGHTTTRSGHFKGDVALVPHTDSVTNNLILTISDTGKGFPPDEIKKVFDKFYRLHNSRAGGTGLGLSIVKGFVEAHDGTIEVYNNNAGGAFFRIEIPAEASYLSNLKNE